ncbi:MAG: aspartyl/glutamyl-tRNA amidotransferase subunit B [candidate division CPR1 bacterium ADurb.Bin160]|jgi:Asp-tRNA(Asn)/Glu-tRNA(Gln) amidotransferase B subunit|uniref:Aspartyl/glutamyl-tRNA amidotransferase subunit B n=1 Tax=candidate division CPR1 bacterium ADurb.Bin160 TaxID=1852826 RepID=A0A1V5ZMZ1_9BACT|nr:MAG: aspartyl/glutamyl-tRNA amidotransferase subunit B [candidate division CPR1 bacterium ADurb.Bin160]
MREKETEADYNYIPEPNIPERDITDIVSEKIDFEFLPYQVEKQLMDSGLSYQEAVFFSADLDKIIALYALSDDKGLYDTAKLLINLPQSVRYDNTVSLSIIKKVFALFSQNKYFDQTLLKIVLDYLSKDPDFDFEQFIDEKTHLTDDLKEAIRKVVAKNPNKSVGSIIGQMIQKNILPQYFSRSLILEFIESL